MRFGQTEIRLDTRRMYADLEALARNGVTGKAAIDRAGIKNYLSVSREDSNGQSKQAKSS